MMLGEMGRCMGTGIKIAECQPGAWRPWEGGASLGVLGFLRSSLENRQDQAQPGPGRMAPGAALRMCESEPRLRPHGDSHPPSVPLSKPFKVKAFINKFSPNK